MFADAVQIPRVSEITGHLSSSDLPHSAPCPEARPRRRRGRDSVPSRVRARPRPAGAASPSIRQPPGAWAAPTPAPVDGAQGAQRRSNLFALAPWVSSHPEAELQGHTVVVSSNVLEASVMVPREAGPVCSPADNARGSSAPRGPGAPHPRRPSCGREATPRCGCNLHFPDD